MLLFTQYKTACLTAISNHCLAEFPAKMYCLLSTVTCSKTPTTVTWSQALRICCHSIIDEGASKFLGVWRNFAGILPNLPEKYFKKLTSKKSLHVNPAPFHVNKGAVIFKSKHVGRHFVSDLQGVLEGSQRFFPDFMGFCPDFHQIKTFGGVIAPPPPTQVHVIVTQ